MHPTQTSLYDVKMTSKKS